MLCYMRVFVFYIKKEKYRKNQISARSTADRGNDTIAFKDYITITTVPIYKVQFIRSICCESKAVSLHSLSILKRSESLESHQCFPLCLPFSSVAFFPPDAALLQDSRQPAIARTCLASVPFVCPVTFAACERSRENFRQR